MSRKIRVFIVDDHGVMRSGLRALIDAQADMEVLGEAADGEEALREIPETAPDVAILDIGLPGMNGVEVAQVLAVSAPATRLLALTMHSEPALVRAVMDAGGAGYVVKDALGDDLVEAIRTVHRGGHFIDTPLTRGEASPAIQLPSRGETDSAGPSMDALSKRERQVIELLAKGFTASQIGEQLGVSAKTAGTYRSRLADKLGIKSRPDIVRYALEVGLLKPPGAMD